MDAVCKGSEEPDQLRQDLADLVPPTNFGGRLKTSSASDLTKFICNQFTKESLTLQTLSNPSMPA